jgi:hypothetical protein
VKNLTQKEIQLNESLVDKICESKTSFCKTLRLKRFEGLNFALCCNRF